MIHHFPRTFRPEEFAPASTVLGPLLPGAYIKLRREAAGLSIEQVAARIGVPGQVDTAVRFLRDLERPGIVAKLELTLQRLRAVFPFDPDVYRQLATEPASRHPLVCRRCGSSVWDFDNACEHCNGDVAHAGCFQ